MYSRSASRVLLCRRVLILQTATATKPRPIATKLASSRVAIVLLNEFGDTIFPGKAVWPMSNAIYTRCVACGLVDRGRLSVKPCECPA